MKKNNKGSENWVDIYLEDCATLGRPTVSISPMSTEEYNRELIAMITVMEEETEWMELFESNYMEWCYPVVEVSPLSTEDYNEELRRIFICKSIIEIDSRIPSIPTQMNLSKVS